MNIREIVMKRGAPPRVPPRLLEDEDETREAAAAAAPPVAAPEAGGPSASPPGMGLPPRSPNEATPPAQPSTPIAAIGSTLDVRPESDRVRAAREVFERIQRQDQEVRNRIPTLTAAVATARTAVREREVAKVLEAAPDNFAAAEEARRLLASAIEAETQALHDSETLRLAESRAAAALSAVVEAEARDEERRALAALQVSAEADRAALLQALDRLWLTARLRGQHGPAQGLLSGVYGIALSGEAMLARSNALFRALVKETA